MAARSAVDRAEGLALQALLETLATLRGASAATSMLQEWQTLACVMSGVHCSVAQDRASVHKMR